MEIVLTSDRDRSTSPVGSLGITRTFRALAEPSNRGKKNVTPQVETERGGGRGVEFGWNSRDGGRGPFVVMATAGFHPLIDPPRSRSSTKPQTLSLFLSDTRTHGDIYTYNLLSVPFEVSSRRTHPFSPRFASTTSNCVNKQRFAFVWLLRKQTLGTILPTFFLLFLFVSSPFVYSYRFPMLFREPFGWK